MSPTVREARLRPQYTHLYPCIPAGTWLPATSIAERLLRFIVSAMGPELRLPDRILNEEHFEFRGGLALAGGNGARERARASRREQVGEGSFPKPEGREEQPRTA
jgi:hypothetical protein